MTLEQECGEDVAVTAVADPDRTGNFEVTVDGKLVHSKTTMGHDRCENATTTQRVVDAVQLAIDAK